MDIYAAFATDESKEEDGVVIFLGNGQDPAIDPWIRVARTGNTAYSKALALGYEKLQAEKKLQRLSDADVEIRAKNLMIEAMADTILKDFGNLKFQGSPLLADRNGKLQVLRVKDFRELVATKAADVALYRVEQVEAAAGN